MLARVLEPDRLVAAKGPGLEVAQLGRDAAPDPDPALEHAGDAAVAGAREAVLYLRAAGWTDDDFGEIKTTGAQDLYILR